MATATATAKPKSRKITLRPNLEATRNYTRREAALVCGVAQITIIRAHESDNLKAYRVGRRVIHSGQHLIDWLEAGGKTSR